MRFLLIFFLIFLFFTRNYAGEFSDPPLVHTFSIIAVDSATGEIGAAVQSHWFSVGSLVIWAEAGVGAVATQSFVNASLGPKGLALMKAGKSPREALEKLLAEDPGREFRQVAFIDAKGNTAARTGKKCIPEAGHCNGQYYSVQANLMLRNSVWPAMERAFMHSSGPLAERLISALEAGQAQGGDIRGQQSAAILVVSGNATGNIWEDRLIDLRVEDNPKPVKELKRLLTVDRAYGHMNAGDLAIEKGDEAGALKEYGTAREMQPANLEMKYWSAVSMVNIGKLQAALPMFQEIFREDPNWKILTPRLVPNGLLKVNPDQLKKIMSLK